jgi:hypothetical protein
MMHQLRHGLTDLTRNKRTLPNPIITNRAEHENTKESSFNLPMAKRRTRTESTSAPGDQDDSEEQTPKH